MRIVLLGSRGQLGWELQRALAPLGELVALSTAGVEPHPATLAAPAAAGAGASRCDRDGHAAPLVGDLRDAAGLRATLQRLQPAVIVNAAAYTDVDRAELEPESAAALNAHAPGLLAREAAALGAWLVHFGSDYVFDGSGDRGWTEDDSPAPLNTYGRSKLAGEQAVRAAGGRHLILRSSWLHAARGRNFVRTILRLAAERDRLEVVADQVGAPTGAELLADVSAHALRAALAAPALAGTYHVAAAGETDRCSYARFIVACARAAGMPLRLRPEAIVPMVSAQRRAAATRPLNCRLDTSKLRQRFGLTLPDWRSGVARTVQELADRAR